MMLNVCLKCIFLPTDFGEYSCLMKTFLIHQANATAQDYTTYL